MKSEIYPFKKYYCIKSEIFPSLRYYHLKSEMFPSKKYFYLKSELFPSKKCYHLKSEIFPILIIASASADASGDEAAAKYSEMSAILGSFHHIWPPLPSLCPPSPFEVVDTLTGSSSFPSVLCKNVKSHFESSHSK